MAAKLNPMDSLSLRHENSIGQGAWIMGTAQLGLDYGAANRTGQPSVDQATVALKAAVEHGVTHLDTARAYGDSETRIGHALTVGLRAGLITKIAPLKSTDAVEVKREIESSVSASLEALGVDQVDALLLHRAYDWWRAGSTGREMLRRFQSEGIATVIGTSLSSPDELLPLLDDPAVGYVQLPFNVCDRRWLTDNVQRAIAQRPDVIITARSVFLQGLLVAGVEASWPTNAGIDPPEMVRIIDQLVGDLDRKNRADLCIAYVLGHPVVTSDVLGSETVQQVHEQGEILRRPPLTKEEVAHVRQALPEGSTALVDPSIWKRG